MLLPHRQMFLAVFCAEQSFGLNDDSVTEDEVRGVACWHGRSQVFDSERLVGELRTHRHKLIGDVKFKLATEGYRRHISIEGLGGTPTMSQW